jgi:hypothetical protein
VGQPLPLPRVQPSALPAEQPPVRAPQLLPSPALPAELPHPALVLPAPQLSVTTRTPPAEQPLPL